MTCLILAGAALLCGCCAGDVPAAASDPVSMTLAALLEPPVGQLPEGDQVFRWTWLRSFHPPVVVTVKKQGGAATMRVKALDWPYTLGPEGARVGKLAIDRQRRLTDAEWDSLARLRRAGFWVQAEETREPAGADGAYWILDGVAWGERHRVSRWSPGAGPFRELCVAMLKLSGLAVRSTDIY